MNRLPPTLPRFAGAAILLVAAFAAGGCNQAHPEESVAGLVIAAGGTIRVTIAEGQQETVEGPAGGALRLTASSGRIVVETAGHGLFVSDAPGIGRARAWRPMAFEAPSGRTSSGMDLSPDGRTLAIVLGDPEAPGLELVTLDMETGAASTRPIDLMANGPPSWLGPDLLALEVIRSDQHSGIATVHLKTGVATVTDTQGFAPSATRDGSRVAVAETTSGVVRIIDSQDWLTGVPSDALGTQPPKDSTIQDVAINADGTRVALACSANSGASWTVVILREAGPKWDKASSIQIPDDAAVSIDWLD
jgi:hypothetical protein